MNVVEDQYAGWTVEEGGMPTTREALRSGILELLAGADGKKLLWIKVPIERSELIPELTALGFEFHHCTATYLMMLKKLIADPVIPPARTYTVGVGAIVRDGSKLLVVKDRFSAGHKLPGGYIDSQETIKDALQREVLEETGIRVEFESIANIGHFLRGQFGESNLYLVGTAKPLSHEITIHDAAEIVDAQWMEMEAFLADPHVNHYNKSVVRCVSAHRELKLVELEVTLTRPAEVFA